MEFLTNLIPFLIFILVLVLITFIIGNTKQKDKINSLSDSIRDRDKTIKDLSENLRIANRVNAERIKDIKSLREENIALVSVKEDMPTFLLDNLRFIMPDGEVANNVKVKTLIKDEQVIGLKATIRRKIKDKYVEVPVTAKYVG